MTLHEVSEAAILIHKMVDPEANIIFGTAIGPAPSEEIKVTVIATGFEERKRVENLPVRTATKEKSPSAEQFKKMLREVGNGDLDWDIPTFLRRQAD